MSFGCLGKFKVKYGATPFVREGVDVSPLYLDQGLGIG